MRHMSNIFVDGITTNVGEGEGFQTLHSISKCWKNTQAFFNGWSGQ